MKEKLDNNEEKQLELIEFVFNTIYEFNEYKKSFEIYKIKFNESDEIVFWKEKIITYFENWNFNIKHLKKDENLLNYNQTFFVLLKYKLDELNDYEEIWDHYELLREYVYYPSIRNNRLEELKIKIEESEWKNAINNKFAFFNQLFTRPSVYQDTIFDAWVNSNKISPKFIKNVKDVFNFIYEFTNSQESIIEIETENANIKINLNDNNDVNELILFYKEIKQVLKNFDKNDLNYKKLNEEVAKLSNELKELKNELREEDFLKTKKEISELLISLIPYIGNKINSVMKVTSSLKKSKKLLTYKSFENIDDIEN